jgi:hypothetical protein
MASASVSSGASPLSAFEFEFEYPQHQHQQQQQQPQQQQQHHYSESASDADDAFWTAISNPSPGSLSGYMSSPAANSIGSSWVVLGSGSPGHVVELEPSPAPLPSPLGSVIGADFDTLSQFAPSTSGVEQGASVSGSLFGDMSAVASLGDVSYLTQENLGFLGPSGSGLVFNDILGVNDGGELVRLLNR